MIKRKEKKRLKKLKRMQKEEEGRERKKSFFCLDFLPFENLIFHFPVFFYSALLLFFLFFLFFIFFFPYHVLPSFGLFVFLFSCYLAFLLSCLLTIFVFFQLPQSPHRSYFFRPQGSGKMAGYVPPNVQFF